MIILDTSFLVGLHNTRDVHHPAAVGLMDRLVAGEWGQALLLEYVFLELTTVLLARRGIDVATRVGRLLLESREVDFLPCSDIFVETFETFVRQPEGTLSFTDAAIATVARREPQAVVATFDRGLARAAGITAVLSI